MTPFPSIDTAESSLQLVTAPAPPIQQLLDSAMSGPTPQPLFPPGLAAEADLEHSQAVEAHNVVATSPALHQQCSPWKNSIKSSTDSSDVSVKIGHNSVALCSTSTAAVKLVTQGQRNRFGKSGFGRTTFQRSSNQYS